MATDTAESPATSNNDPLAAALTRWRAQVDRDLKGAPFEKRLITRTPEGIALQPLYTRLDLPRGVSPKEQPGQAPFRRGLKPAGEAKACRRLQRIKAADAATFNKVLRAALMAGQDAVVVPTPGNTAGWSPATLAELQSALAGVELTAVPVTVGTESGLLGAAALLVALAREQDVDLSQLSGDVAADPIARAVTANGAPVDWKPAYDEVAGWLNWTRTNAPQLRAAAVDARVWNDAGASAVQELGFALASLVELLRETESRGVSPAYALAATVVKFGVGPRFFTELAKFRAWRVLVSKVLGGLELDTSLATNLSVQASTASWNKTLLDAHVNMLRTTTESLSAVLGGVDGLDIGLFDETAGETGPLAERVARNLHTLVQEEFGFVNPQDAAGGSWYIENLTDQLAHKAWEVFQEIEKQGGMRAALAAGWPQAQVAAVTAGRDKNYAVRRNGLVGSNLFPNARDDAKREVADRGMPATTLVAIGWPDCLDKAVDALRAGRSVEELSGVVAAASRDVVSWDSTATYRAAEPFEKLRRAAAKLADCRGRAPTAFLARMGPVKQHKPRADFSAGFLTVGGFAITGKESQSDAATAAQAALASEADVVVICSNDDTYPEIVPALAQAVKAAKPEVQIVLAGYPSDEALKTTYTEAGVDVFIHIRADVPATLTQLLTNVGAEL